MFNINRCATWALSLSLGLATTGVSAPVVYTLRTVADGQLGSQTFQEALVTIRMQSDTKTVKKLAGSNGGALYTNSGRTSVSISQQGKTITAYFAPGEVYVRYDAGAGIAGFGSPISATYPIALDCDDYAYPSAAEYVADCVQGNWGPIRPFGNFDDGILGMLAIAAYYGQSQAFAVPAVLALPANLSQSTLLTGGTHSCATVYVVAYDFSGSGDLALCAGPAPRGLHTDHGGFSLRDAIGGTLNPPNPFGTFWAGWSVANSGSLQVEVLSGEDD
jgi:hypothetical protein